MTKRKTNEEYDLELIIKNIPYKRVDKYMTALIKINHECLRCGLIFSMRPNDILNKHGCRQCNPGTIKYTNKEIDKALEGRNIVRINNYINSETPIEFNCTICNITWKTKPAHILNSNTGCPNCANSGFQPQLRAYLYFIQIEDFLKVGITNREPKVRYKEITDKEVIEIKVIEGLGKDMYELEQMIHKKYTHYNPNNLKSGNTECFSLDLKDSILKEISKW